MRTYLVTFELANGKQIEAICDHVPLLGYAIRIPGTETYAEPIAIAETVTAGDTCSDPHCAACDAGVQHTRKTSIRGRM